MFEKPNRSSVTFTIVGQASVTCQLMGHYGEPNLGLPDVDLGPLTTRRVPHVTVTCSYDPATGTWMGTGHAHHFTTD